jgi:hypothetical protein
MKTDGICRTPVSLRMPWSSILTTQCVKSEDVDKVYSETETVGHRYGTDSNDYKTTLK